MTELTLRIGIMEIQVDMDKHDKLQQFGIVYVDLNS